MIRKTVCLTIISLAFFTASANEIKRDLDLKTAENKVVKLKKSKNQVFRDCVLTIKGNYGGHQVDVVVTISDVSYVKCLALKTGIAAYKN